MENRKNFSDSWKNCITTGKQQRLDHMRMLMDPKYQRNHTSSASGSELGQNDQELLPDGNGDEKQAKLQEVYNNLKSKAQAYRNIVSKMVFATKSGYEVKAVLSEYGERLLSDREMREFAPIMLAHLENGQAELGNLLIKHRQNTTDNVALSFLTNVDRLHSQLKDKDIAQAKATYQEISEQAKRLFDNPTEGQEQTLMKINGAWAMFESDVQKELGKNNNAKHDGKVDADNPEITSLYLEHVLAESQGKTLTEVMNRLHELHEFLTKRIDEHMRNSAVANEQIPDSSRGLLRYRQTAYGNHS